MNLAQDDSTASDQWENIEQIPKLAPDVLHNLTRLNGYYSLAAFLFDWLVIVAAIALCERYGYWLYPVAFVLIGSRLHAFGALMHDGAHRRLSNNRFLNEVLGEACAWPEQYSMLVYRRERHFAHHRNIGTLDDSHLAQTYDREPQRWDFPMPRSRFAKYMIISALIWPMKTLGSLIETPPALWRLSKPRFYGYLAFQILLIAAITLGTIFWGWGILLKFFLYWLLPRAWTSSVTGYFRLVGEHFGIPNQEDGTATRTLRASFAAEALFWPHNLNYHLEHHWYPAIPWYNLPKIHRHLARNPSVKNHMHVTYGHRGLFKELLVER